MLDHIDRQQRNKLKLDNLSIPSPERHRPLRHQFSSDNMHVPPFNIPNLRIDQRKTSSAEDMARKNSTGLWLVCEVYLHHIYVCFCKRVILPQNFTCKKCQGQIFRAAQLSPGRSRFFATFSPNSVLVKITFKKLEKHGNTKSKL